MSRKKNNYFQFKQFLVRQEGAGMKVTTEACILGGWVSGELKPARILDIGTGTGLLALMLAQKFPKARVKAVELDVEAYHLARKNVGNSQWSERISLYNCAIQDFEPGCQYDLIVCNPPFYHRSLEATNERENRARHDKSLSQNDLAHHLKRLMKSSGHAYILYPPAESSGFVRIAENSGMYVDEVLTIYNRPDDESNREFRKIVRLSFQKGTYENTSLIIRNEQGEYSEEFVRLLKPYYLYL